VAVEGSLFCGSGGVVVQVATMLVFTLWVLIYLTFRKLHPVLIYLTCKKIAYMFLVLFQF